MLIHHRKKRLIPNFSQNITEQKISSSFYEKSS